MGGSPVGGVISVILNRITLIREESTGGGSLGPEVTFDERMRFGVFDPLFGKDLPLALFFLL